MFEIAIVSDEISRNFREAVTLGTSWGVHRYEVRNLLSGRIPDIDPEEEREVVHCCAEFGATVTAISPGLFKGPVADEAGIRRDLESALFASFSRAEMFGCRAVIIFGLACENRSDDGERNRVIETLSAAARIASRNGFILLLENEPGFWCDTGTRTAGILRDVNSPALRANWDPCNAFGLGEAVYPAGFQALKPFIANVHVKDTVEGSAIRCVPIGEGAIDWRGQLAALASDASLGHVTVETHCEPLAETSRRNVELLQAWQKENFGVETLMKTGDR